MALNLEIIKSHNTGQCSCGSWTIILVKNLNTNLFTIIEELDWDGKLSDLSDYNGEWLTEHIALENFDNESTIPPW